MHFKVPLGTNTVSLKVLFCFCFFLEAVKEMNNIVEHIETLMKEQENIGRMIKIQRCLQNGKPKIITPGRKLLKEGKLDKVKSNYFC